MNKKDLDTEFKEYDSIELRYIYETQTDLYSPEELAYMLEVIEEKERTETEAIEKLLPEKIACPKCGVFQPFSNDSCQYCEWTFDKTQYYENARLKALGRFDVESDTIAYETDDSPSFVLQYVVSFILPIVGLIMGAVFLTKSDDEEKSAGIMCLVVGVIGALVWSLLCFFIL